MFLHKPNSLRFFKFLKVPCSIEVKLFIDKPSISSLVNLSNVLGSIVFSWFEYKYRDFKFIKWLKVSKWMKSNWLFDKNKYSKEHKPLKVSLWIDVKSFLLRSISSSEKHEGYLFFRICLVSLYKNKLVLKCENN